MKTLKVWICSQTHDSSVYNIVARTKRDALGLLAKQWDRERYSQPELVEIRYEDAFDLYELVTGEGGGRHGSY